MPKPTIRERSKALKAQSTLTSSIPHIEALVATVVGRDWLEVVNRERREGGRREYRAGGSDERAALALLAHAPGLRERWPQATRSASQLGGILNSANHNDAERWNKGDADRATQLAGELLVFLSEHPVAQMQRRWIVIVEAGTIPAGKRKPLVSDTAVVRGEAGESLSQVLAGRDIARVLAGVVSKGHAVVTSMPAVAEAASRDPRVSETETHFQVAYRDTATDSVTAVTLTIAVDDLPKTSKPQLVVSLTI